MSTKNRHTRRAEAATEKKYTASNGKQNSLKVIRKMQPSLPHAIGSLHNGPNIILDFMGSNVTENSREVFASLLLNKRMAKDIITQMEKYLEYMETYKEDDEEV